ncbi:hypothetical protein ACK3F5_14275 [Photorhabdus asymbiotica UENP]
MTGVSECSQQRGNLKDNRYIYYGENSWSITWGHPLTIKEGKIK